MSTFDPRTRTRTGLGPKRRTTKRPPRRRSTRMNLRRTQPAGQPEVGSSQDLSGGSSWKLAFPPNCLPYCLFFFAAHLHRYNSKIFFAENFPEIKYPFQNVTRFLGGGENSKCQPSLNFSECCDPRNKGSTPPKWARFDKFENPFCPTITNIFTDKQKIF